MLRLSKMIRGPGKPLAGKSGTSAVWLSLRIGRIALKAQCSRAPKTVSKIHRARSVSKTLAPPAGCIGRWWGCQIRLAPDPRCEEVAERARLH